MTPISRHYQRDVDYERVNLFLLSNYDPSASHVNWLQPRWEYMHYHPLIRKVDLALVRVWEDEGDIVGVAHLEHHAGQVYFQIHPRYGDLKREMIAQAERYLCAEENGIKTLAIYIDDRDLAFQQIAAEMGYQMTAWKEEALELAIADVCRPATMPEGFVLKSLEDDNDLRKLTRLLFRGFDHGEEPPDDGIEDRDLMQSAPNYDKSLNIVVEAPDGAFVSYCGMWYEPAHRIAYVEPVCTDPSYRRMHLGSAAVVEGIRRCAMRGATTAYVGGFRPIYQSLGFTRTREMPMWRKEWR